MLELYQFKIGTSCETKVMEVFNARAIHHRFCQLRSHDNALWLLTFNLDQYVF
ncbi:Uncharacterised protein [Vibrio cholerae]|nr:Uncharacterised protein [Vibrio cholerae]